MTALRAMYREHLEALALRLSGRTPAVAERGA
jgi:hypothetical protein